VASARAAHPSPFAAVADKAAPRTSATARWDPPVGPVFYLESEPDTSCAATARAIRARSLGFARFQSFKYRPEALLTPQSISSRSRRVKLTGIRRRDPPNPQSAAAVHLEPREPLAGLPVALAKSPNRFFRDFVYSVRS
jgi:hypothetical protein